MPCHFVKERGTAMCSLRSAYRIQRLDCYTFSQHGALYLLTACRPDIYSPVGA